MLFSSYVKKDARVEGILEVEQKTAKTKRQLWKHCAYSDSGWDGDVRIMCNRSPAQEIWLSKKREDKKKQNFSEMKMKSNYLYLCIVVGRMWFLYRVAYSKFDKFLMQIKPLSVKCDLLLLKRAFYVLIFVSFFHLFFSVKTLIRFVTLIRFYKLITK